MTTVETALGPVATGVAATLHDRPTSLDRRTRPAVVPIHTSCGPCTVTLLPLAA